ncbi:uncharacterized protein EAE98_010722 [Botrytis deweyae]|uniref:Uncharacterized protein n=1 Tax=Botrytis deweyae TaxID=2478750 RepID=A0ABQ7I810_9HELO|nr:uncharacterized protein EAE98_010722 [Botrytis deweyae]KAF7916422.1 hypothetical protein EAE98_010722 [Botrytis deweyae]
MTWGRLFLCFGNPLDRTKWGLSLLGNNGIMASEHRRMRYNPILWVETDGMGHLAWVELGNRIG